MAKAKRRVATETRRDSKTKPSRARTAIESGAKLVAFAGLNEIGKEIVQAVAPHVGHALDVAQHAVTGVMNNPSNEDSFRAAVGKRPRKVSGKVLPKKTRH